MSKSLEVRKTPPSDRQHALNLHPIAVKHTFTLQKENIPSANLEISDCHSEEAGVLRGVLRQLSPAVLARGIPK